MTNTQLITTGNALELLQALYQYAKDSNSDGVLNSSRTLSLSGVSVSIQNRVLMLAGFNVEVENLELTIQSILSEVSPAEKINISTI